MEVKYNTVTFLLEPASKAVNFQFGFPHSDALVEDKPTAQINTVKKNVSLIPSRKQITSVRKTECEKKPSNKIMDRMVTN